MRAPQDGGGQSQPLDSGDARNTAPDTTRPAGSLAESGRRDTTREGLPQGKGSRFPVVM